jgi:hypothetical protein
MRKVIGGTIGALLVWMALPFMFAIHSELGAFLHRELAYRVISNRLVTGLETDEEKTRAIMAFVYLNEAQFDDWALAQDRNVLHDLVRNIGWCDQKANGMVHLLDKQGIAARMVMFPCHSFAEVIIDGQPRVFDPEFNGYFVSKSDRNSIATLQDVLQHSNELTTRNGQSFEAYPKKEVLTCGKPQRWNYLQETRSFAKNALIQLMNIHVALGGNTFTWMFQDWYFAVSPLALNDPMEQEHFRARCLDLLGRTDKAIDIYGENKSPRSQFFLVKALLESKRFAEAQAGYQRNANTLNAIKPEKDAEYVLLLANYIAKLQAMSNADLIAAYRLSKEEFSAFTDVLGTLSPESNN